MKMMMMMGFGTVVDVASARSGAIMPTMTGLQASVTKAILFCDLPSVVNRGY